MMPRPPSCAIAIARPDSVTVSIAALISGTFRRMLRVNHEETSTCVGSTVECCGTSRTSSKVSAVAMSAVTADKDSGAVFSSMGPLDVQIHEGPTHCRPCLHHAAAPWHFLYFLPLPHGHGSFRPTFGSSRRTVLMASSRPVRAGCGPPGPLGIGSAVAEEAAEERAAANAGTVSAPGLLVIIRDELWRR